MDPCLDRAWTVLGPQLTNRSFIMSKSMLDCENDLLPECPDNMLASRPTYNDLKLALNRIGKLERRIVELEAETAQLRGPVRPSIEVLQRMANGLDPFDRGRFQCAVA